MFDKIYYKVELYGDNSDFYAIGELKENGRYVKDLITREKLYGYHSFNNLLELKDAIKCNNTPYGYLLYKKSPVASLTADEVVGILNNMTDEDIKKYIEHIYSYKETIIKIQNEIIKEKREYRKKEKNAIKRIRDFKRKIR